MLSIVQSSTAAFDQVYTWNWTNLMLTLGYRKKHATRSTEDRPEILLRQSACRFINVFSRIFRFTLQTFSASTSSELIFATRSVCRSSLNSHEDSCVLVTPRYSNHAETRSSWILVKLLCVNGFSLGVGTALAHRAAAYTSLAFPYSSDAHSCLAAFHKSQPLFLFGPAGAQNAHWFSCIVL